MGMEMEMELQMVDLSFGMEMELEMWMEMKIPNWGRAGFNRARPCGRSFRLASHD